MPTVNAAKAITFEKRLIALYLITKLFVRVVKNSMEILAATAADRLDVAQSNDFPKCAPRLPGTGLGVGAEKLVATSREEIGVASNVARRRRSFLALPREVQLIG
jgi:hypothetical protein